MPDLELEGTTADIARGLEAMSLDSTKGIRPRTAAVSRMLELAGVTPDSVPQLPCDPLPPACRRMKARYRHLLGWSERGYLLIPTPWGRDGSRVNPPGPLVGQLGRRVLQLPRSGNPAVQLRDTDKSRPF